MSFVISKSNSQGFLRDRKAVLRLWDWQRGEERQMLETNQKDKKSGFRCFRLRWRSIRRRSIPEHLQSHLFLGFLRSHCHSWLAEQSLHREKTKKDQRNRGFNVEVAVSVLQMYKGWYTEPTVGGLLLLGRQWGSMVLVLADSASWVSQIDQLIGCLD